jgi:hypothetical protein
MREFVSAEIMCKDRFGNEITVHEISVEENFGSSDQPDFHVQKDRFETAKKSRVSLLDASTFQLVDSGEIVRRTSPQSGKSSFSQRAA